MTLKLKMLLICIYILLGASLFADGLYLCSIILSIFCLDIINDIIKESIIYQTVILYEYKQIDYN